MSARDEAQKAFEQLVDRLADWDQTVAKEAASALWSAGEQERAVLRLRKLRSRSALGSRGLQVLYDNAPNEARRVEFDAFARRNFFSAGRRADQRSVLLKVLLIVGIFAAKEYALFWWPGRESLNVAIGDSIYSTSGAHFILSLLFLGANSALTILFFAFLVQIAPGLNPNNLPGPLFWVFAFGVFFFAISLSGKEARIICALLGWKHTGSMIIVL